MYHRDEVACFPSNTHTASSQLYKLIGKKSEILKSEIIFPRFLSRLVVPFSGAQTQPFLPPSF